MKHKLWLGLGAAAVLLLSLCAPQLPRAYAQAASQPVPFSLSAVGQTSAAIIFNTPISSCGVVVNNGGTFTLVPQSTNDGNTWVTATGINSGSITGTGSFTGGVANTGLYAFRVRLTGVDSTAVTGTIACSGALARVSGGGATGSPGPPGPAVQVTQSPGITVVLVTSSPANVYQVGVNAGTCLGIVAGALAYTCASPTAGPALPLSIANGGTATSAPSPQIAATACGASPSLTGVWPAQTINVPAGCTSGGVTAVTGSGNIAVSAGATPNVTITNAPTFTGPLSASSLTASGLASGNCVQTTTGGLFTTAAGACSAGGGLSTIQGTEPIETTTPSAGTVGIQCPTCLVQETASPIPPVVCIQTNASGKAKGALGPCVVLQSPGATPSPQSGFVALTTGVVIAPSPFATASASAIKNAVIVRTSNQECEFGNYVDWGTTSNAIDGIDGQLFALGCDNDAGSFVVCGGGATGHGSCANEGLWDSTYTGGPGFRAAYTSGYEFVGASTSLDNCYLKGVGSLSGAISVTHSTGSGTCTLSLPDAVAANNTLCTGTSSLLVGCSTLSTMSGEVTCSISSAQSCTVTATVRAGSHCVATPNSTDTTGVATTQIKTPQVSNVVGTTVTFTLVVQNSGTGTLAANYWCP